MFLFLVWREIEHGPLGQPLAGHAVAH
jgi:hypothetical protein